MNRERRRPNTQVEDQLAARLQAAEPLASLAAQEVVAMAEEFGRVLAKNVRLKTTQVRRFFEACKRAAAALRADPDADAAGLCADLRPLLAYTAGRVDTARPLMRVLDPCLQRIQTADDFLTFFRFLEATLAYHRYYGGRDY